MVIIGHNEMLYSSCDPEIPINHIVEEVSSFSKAHTRSSLFRDGATNKSRGLIYKKSSKHLQKIEEFDGAFQICSINGICVHVDTYACPQAI